LGKTLKELAMLVGGKIDGNPETVIESAAPIETARKGDITFIANVKYTKFLDTTAASAVVVSEETKSSRIPLIRHKNPYYAFAVILDSLYPDRLPEQKIHESAVIENSATIGEGTSIGALCYVGNGVVIGTNCRIYPRVSILDGTRIGNNVIIHSGAVIGADGFGFAPAEKGFKKVKQIGWVEIESEVEIGANTTIDRGALGPTRIGHGTKIDNLVQIAHNVEVGKNCAIAAQAGIAGSTKLGNGVIMAGQVGLVGHIEVGDGVKVGAQSGVAKSIPAGKTYFGSPARASVTAMKIEACLSRLPELFKRVKKIEER
jgi:UDP-3-O-[3-hydroxymyristoyl] glucosamine N-acyltransferase